MNYYQKVHALCRFQQSRVYSKLKNSECQSKGSGVFHCTSLFPELGPLPQLFQSGICKIIRDMDIALVNIHLNRNRTPLYLQSLYKDIFCAKSLNCWFFRQNMHQIQILQLYQSYWAMHLHKGKRIHFSIPCIEEAQKTFMTGIQNHDPLKVQCLLRKLLLAF